MYLLFSCLRSECGADAKEVQRYVMCRSRSSSVPGLHTLCRGFRAHAFARSVTAAISPSVHGSSSSRQQRRWDIVWSSPQLHSIDVTLVVIPF